MPASITGAAPGPGLQRAGLMLWANNIALKLFPKIWLDVATVIHFYEAILAGGAIVIWHFYSRSSIPMPTRWTPLF